ncbi:MAG: DUF378 domain-containing protein [Clostridia bacterium]|nr:DUF378 domain-containing protein [Clostridia bacterium]
MFKFTLFMITQIGSINWFCIGLFQFDIIAGIFGSQAEFISRFIYTIIGICGIFMIVYAIIKRGNLNLTNSPKNKK